MATLTFSWSSYLPPASPGPLPHFSLTLYPCEGGRAGLYLNFTEGKTEALGHAQGHPATQWLV